MASQQPPRQPERTAAEHKVTVPEGNTDLAKKAAAPLATVSSHADPYPHYLMTGACLGAAYHSWAKAGNPRMAGAKVAFAAAYLWAGRLLANGNPRLGYDLGSVTSLGLLAFAGPRAWATGEVASTAMASLGGISAATNLIKSYQQRTGKPRELGYTRE